MAIDNQGPTFDASAVNRLLQINGANSGGGGGAASGGGHKIGGPSNHLVQAAQTHTVQHIEALIEAIPGIPGFGKTADQLSALSYEGGLFNMFGEGHESWVEKLGTKGGALANMLAKHVTKDIDHGKYEIHNIWSAGGCQVDTSFHADNGSLISPPAIGGDFGGHGRGGGSEIG